MSDFTTGLVKTKMNHREQENVALGPVVKVGCCSEEYGWLCGPEDFCVGEWHG